MTTRKILYKLPDFFLAQLLSLSLVLALTTSLGLTYPHGTTYLFILAFTFVFALAFSNRISRILSGIIAGLGLIIAAYNLLVWIGLHKFGVFLDDYFYWLGDFIENQGTPDRLYQLITVVALCVVISLTTYLLTVKKFMFYVLLVIGSAIFTIQWSYNLSTTLLPFFLFLPAILMLYFKHIHKKKSAAASNEFTESGVFTLWTIPVCIVAILIASALHVNEKPLEWKWLDTKINSVYNYFNSKFDYEVFDYFSVSSSGFGSRDNILGGRVKLDRTAVLSVDTPHNVYLRGIVSDVYTGTKWTAGNPGKQVIGTDFASLYEDTDEMVDGMKLLAPEMDYLSELFFKDTINITFQNLKTKSLFMPSKITNITPKSDITGVVDANGSLSVSDRLTRGFNYSVDLYSPKLGSEEFADILRKSRRGLYADSLENLRSSRFLSPYSSNRRERGAIITEPLDETEIYYGIGPSFDTTSASAEPSNRVYTIRIIDYREVEKLTRLSEKALSIDQKYTQLPESLPQRVRDLALSITASADNDYDKVKAIEQYLSSNFPYNLDVRTTPRNRDFVDYFLFDIQQGYCTYYASAMAILARCAGIPARYAEGYILPPAPAIEGSNLYTVTNMQAHAWAEIYFEGYGWLPFEATSPFRSNFYSDNTISASISTDYNAAYEDYMDLVRRYATDHNSDGFDLPLKEEEKEPNYLLMTLISIGAVILIFLAVIAVNLFRSKLRLFKILNLPSKDCVLKLYEYFIGILTLQGYGLLSGETPYQYSDRIDRMFYFEPVRFKIITGIFVKNRYSAAETTAQEKQILNDFTAPFMKETRSNMGKLKFFLHKCILGKI